jgi:hypothetical protein
MKYQIGTEVTIQRSNGEGPLVKVQVVGYDSHDDTYLARFLGNDDDSRESSRISGFTLNDHYKQSYSITLAQVGEVILWIAEHEAFTHKIIDAQSSEPVKRHAAKDESNPFYADRLQAGAQYNNGPSGETGGPSGLSFL